MYGAFGNTASIRTIAIGCAVAAAVCTVATVRPKAFPLPHVSLLFIGSALAADASVITISSADAMRASALVASIDDVHTQADLVAYADALMRADSHIAQIQISDDSISMEYETTSSLLNIKTVSDLTRASVAEDGTVSISGSWYRPLLMHTAQASSPSVGFSDIIMKQASGSDFDPATQAHILARLHGRFRIGALQ